MRIVVLICMFSLLNIINAGITGSGFAQTKSVAKKGALAF